MGNKTGKDHTFQVRVLNDLGNGKMDKLSDGLKGNNLFEYHTLVCTLKSFLQFGQQ